MPTNVILPALGIAQDTGKIIEWLKAEGETVTEGEALVTVETDKAAVDLEAPASGVLAHVSAKVGDEVPVARVIAVILSPNEVSNGVAPSRQPTAPSPSQPSSPEPAALPTGQAPVAATADGTPQSHNGRRASSPKARRIADERGIDVAALRGSGPGGVVLAADVLAASPSSPPTPAQTSNGTSPVPPVQPSPAQTATSPAAKPAERASAPLGVSAAWRLMAERTTESWTTVPHFFLVREVNASKLIARRARVAQQAAENVTYTDLLVALVAESLRAHPRLNARWANGAIVANDEVNIGIAVANVDGLVVPVIRQSDDLSLRGIAKQRADLVARAQAGQLRLHDLQDGTFTISNLGMFGVDAFNAIINPPQAAILAVGRIADRVTPLNGQPAVQPMMTLTLSCDHRVVDGVGGARFLDHLARLIEDPA
jgi:pyruvate dehydrogenase E2 component (dihydrolipoamide acetyltransferase)